MDMLPFGPAVWERIVRAVEKVRERMLRAATALKAAGIPYAVAGGNAVAAWVARVDEATVRNTPDVDILLRLKDQVHIQDFITVGLVDATWLARLPPELGARLQQLLDNPDG